MHFTLRPWTFNDLESGSKHARNPKITQNMSDGFPNSIENWKAFLEFAVNNNNILYLAIDIQGEAVGGIGITPKKDYMQKNAELGYWLSEEYWGKGIITEAIKEIVKLAFEKFDIVRIYATPFERNYASHKVLEKVGFKLEARFSKIVYKNGEMLDKLVYSIRRHDVTSENR